MPSVVILGETIVLIKPWWSITWVSNPTLALNINDEKYRFEFNMNISNLARAFSSMDQPRFDISGVINGTAGHWVLA